MKQASLQLKLSAKKTRKQVFLAQMEKVVPWDALVALIAPYYPQGKTGRPPFSLHTMLHGQEKQAFGDAGYQGIDKRPNASADVTWHVAMRPGKRRKLNKSDPLDKLTEQIEKAKASIRAKVEHPFRVIKRQFGHVKTRYRGLKKNTAQLVTLFALCNLWMARHRLQEMRG